MPSEKRCCRRSRRRVYARVGRIPIGGDDSRASALPKNGDYLYFRHPSDRCRPPARVRNGSGGLRSGSRRAGGSARQGQSLCGAISQDPPARTIESRTGTQGGGSNRGVEIIGDAATSSWDEGQYRIFGVNPNSFTVELDNVRALIHPEDWERLRAALANVNEHAPTFQTEFRVHRPNGDLRWCIGAAAASIDATHRVVRLGGVTVDITDRKSAEERQTLLVREVDHRARNALAVVQSIVRLTRADSKEAYISAVEERITALSRAHVLLSESRWQGANLSRLLDEELAPYRRSEPEKIVTNGPAAFLEPATAQILALTLHELATNAAQYGALSSTVGRVRLSGQVGPSHLELQWVETGGPSVQPPHSEGYGTRVITASVERQLDGCATFDWHPEGLRFTMSIPLGEKTKQPESGSRVRWTTEEDKGAALRKVMAGNRLLLVEDEALTGMMMRDMLTELGFDVIGPFGRVGDAMAAVRCEDFRPTVFDVNRDGEMVYSVADAVGARGVPFVFVTGYGVEGIDGRFSQVVVPQKPRARDELQREFLGC